MYKVTIWIAVLVVVSNHVIAQKKTVDDIKQLIIRNEAEAHLTFLAADEMRGRNAGSPELDIAANYIRAQFNMHNLKPAPGAENYFQKVDLVKSLPPLRAEASIGKDNFVLKENLIVLGGEAFQWNGDMVFVGYGSPEELAKQNIKGKMILALAGSKDADNINKVYVASRDKFDAVKKLGGAGLIEILALSQVPWSALVNALGQEQWSITQSEEKTTVPFIWVKPTNLKELSFKESETVPGKIFIEKVKPQLIPGRNVAAIVEGTDPKLKDEYVVITAHYDHIGVQKPKNNEDSIFNGARDNAIGTVALIQTAKFLSKYPPKRSVILLAVTSEEKGLLGSKWYAENPLVPLQKHALNINCDGVGYNDKTRVTSISLGRTNTDHLLEQAAKAFGFTLGGDPDPKEGFYERSDQASFAKKGIPAVKLQPGLAQMDDEIRRYYHRQADEVASLDLDYITRFYRTFVYAVHLLVNDPQKPAWKPGDKFEEVNKKLRGE